MRQKIFFHPATIFTPMIYIALLLAFAPVEIFAAPATTSMRLLYPSFSGSWATAWIAKEAGYLANEGLRPAQRRRWRPTPPAATSLSSVPPARSLPFV
jgi:ABC-type nitrate/sulfonate/bicarbonate transport system substrate-binding protein